MRRKQIHQVLLLLFLIPLITGCWPFPSSQEKNTIESHNGNVSVVVPAQAVESGTAMKIIPAPATVPATPQSVTPLGGAVQITPSKGDVHGSVTISFTYSKQLPKGNTPKDLMIMEYNPMVDAWLPIPSQIDTKSRELTVTTTQLTVAQNTSGRAPSQTVSLLNSFSITKEYSFFSKAWKLVATNFDAIQSIAELAKDIGKDAIKNHGDFLKGFLDRMLPPPPEIKCDKPNYRLLTDITGSMALPKDSTVCVQTTDEPDVVEVKVANTNTYPVWVSIPQGMEIEKQAQDIEYDHIEEILLQCMSLTLHNHGFLLRGDHVIVLKAHLSQIKPSSRIVLQLEPVSLVADMMMWLIELATGEKTEKWAGQLEKLENASDVREAFNSVTECENKGIVVMKEHFGNAGNTEGGNGKKSVLVDVLKLIGDCALSLSGVVYTIWTKIGGTVEKEAEKEVNPIVSGIDKFKTIYENPQMITAWITGLIAWFTPDNAGKIYIDVSINIDGLKGVDWTKVITDMDCSYLGQGLQVDALQFADVTDDGNAEAFVAVSCKPINDSWPDYLEVFDGASDPAHPRHMATLLDYHDSPPEVFHDSGLYMEGNESITISGHTVTIISGAGEHVGGPFLTVTDVFTWDGSRFVRGQRSVSQQT